MNIRESKGPKDRPPSNDERIAGNRNKRQGSKATGGEGLIIPGALKCYGSIELRIPKPRLTQEKALRSDIDV